MGAVLIKRWLFVPLLNLKKTMARGSMVKCGARSAWHGIALLAVIFSSCSA